MRETKNIKLTQFDPNDVPNWLDQYNTDMEKIDAANGSQSATNAEYDARFTTDEKLIKNNRTQINENTQDIANIKDDIKNITGGSGTSLKTLQDEITTVGQDITNLKGGSTRTIAELENDINTDGQNINALNVRAETLEDSVTTLKTKVGTASIANVGSDITTAIGNYNIDHDSITHAIYDLEKSGGLTAINITGTCSGELTANTLVKNITFTLNYASLKSDLRLSTRFFAVYNVNNLVGIAILDGLLLLDSGTTTKNISGSIYALQTINASYKINSSITIATGA